MHEVGMAFDIVDIVDQLAKERGISVVHCIYVTVGEYSGIVPDALRGGFGAACDRSECCKKARLKIEVVAGCVACLDCGGTYHLAAPDDACPRCHSARRSVLFGKEFAIAAIDHD